jgi:hypothetical protein
MVSDLGYFRFLLLRAQIDVPIPTLYVQITLRVGQTNFHTRTTFSYSRPHVRLSSYFYVRVCSSLYRVIASSRAYRCLSQYVPM